VWHNVHSQQHTYMSSSYRSSRLGFSHWDPYAMHRGSCLEFIIVTWWSGPGGIQSLSERPTGFIQCFDTVGLVIWPVKIVADMAYNVFGGTLNIAHSLTAGSAWFFELCSMPVMLVSVSVSTFRMSRSVRLKSHFAWIKSATKFLCVKTVTTIHQGYWRKMQN